MGHAGRRNAGVAASTNGFCSVSKTRLHTAAHLVDDGRHQPLLGILLADAPRIVRRHHLVHILTKRRPLLHSFWGHAGPCEHAPACRTDGRRGSQVEEPRRKVPVQSHNNTLPNRLPPAPACVCKPQAEQPGPTPASGRAGQPDPPSAHLQHHVAAHGQGRLQHLRVLVRQLLRQLLLHPAGSGGWSRGSGAVPSRAKQAAARKLPERTMQRTPAAKHRRYRQQAAAGHSNFAHPAAHSMSSAKPSGRRPALSTSACLAEAVPRKMDVHRSTRSRKDRERR